MSRRKSLRLVLSLIFTFFLLLLVVDQLARNAAANFAEQDSEYFFDRIRSVDFSAFDKRPLYEACEVATIRWGYEFKTCFRSEAFRRKQTDGSEIEIYRMVYWGPRSHFTSQFVRWWYYESGNSSRTIFHVTEDNTIIGDFLNE